MSNLEKTSSEDGRIISVLKNAGDFDKRLRKLFTQCLRKIKVTLYFNLERVISVL